MHAIPSPSPSTSLSSSHPTTTMLSLFRHYCCYYYYVMSTTILLCALVILNHSVTAFHITSQAPIVLFPSITSSASSTTRISFSSSKVSTTSHHHSSSSALSMVRNRGLERRVEGATPLRKFTLCTLVCHNTLIDALKIPLSLHVKQNTHIHSGWNDPLHQTWSRRKVHRRLSLCSLCSYRTCREESRLRYSTLHAGYQAQLVSRGIWW